MLKVDFVSPSLNPISNFSHMFQGSNYHAFYTGIAFPFIFWEFVNVFYWYHFPLDISSFICKITIWPRLTHTATKFRFNI